MTVELDDLADASILLRPDVLDDPGPLYELLRREAPVWQLPGQQSYLVTDPALVREAVGRTAELSSNLVSLLHRGDSGGLVSFDVVPFGDPAHVLATADPPAHTRHRRLLQPHLSPAAVAALEPELRRVVDEHLAPLLAEGRGDVVPALGNPVPAIAICLLLGVPTGDATSLMELVLDLGALLDGVTDLDGMGRASGAALDMAAYAAMRLDDVRAQDPPLRSGLLAVLADAIDADELTSDEALNILLQLVSAGTETTASLIANSIEILARDRQRQDELRRNPSAIPDAIEEILREDGPFQFHYRWTTTDTTLGNVRIPANSRVLLMWAAANRPMASTTGPGAPEGSHLAFGRGLHFCIGAPLARLEGRIVLERLLARAARVALDPDRPPVRRPSVMLRRHHRLPVLLEPAREHP